MKMRHLALVAAISVFATGNTLAQSNWSNTNTNTNNTTSFSNNSFSLSGSNMNISQSGTFTTEPDAFCQFFSFTFGLTRIVQIIQGNSFTQTFGSASDPVEDPCL
ncbi:MAG TPA: hypothetical protein ENJ65_00285 [Candidatus Tenderia electrophaga]|uniref:Uncharacterized protein n=1 Tax=Candidatus Tenderia electrophaga TaxID=1748243 RepID=A0A832J254_9GAMM|nr:hypothetical protein [Candidatus Tenderia electrophaga]